MKLMTKKKKKVIHSQLLVNGFLNGPDLVSKFAASMALKHPQNMDYSVQLLDQCENPSVFALNSLIKVYSKRAQLLKKASISIKEL